MMFLRNTGIGKIPLVSWEKTKLWKQNVKDLVAMVSKDWILKIYHCSQPIELYDVKLEKEEYFILCVFRMA